MLGLFKKKNPKRELQKKYEKLLKQAHDLSTIDRAASDKIRVEAERVAEEMENLG